MTPDIDRRWELVEGGSQVSADAYPWLADMGEVTLEARAGHLESVGTRESANCTFSLDNTSRQAATLLGRPVRAAAVAFDDDGNELLSGLLQQVQYGTLLVGTIEA